MEIAHDWITMLVRWWHLVAGIIWIGSSFYFNWLDSLFRPTNDKTLKPNNRGVFNETHACNFYYHEQYFPQEFPKGLHAHAWPSRMTFISGLLLLVLIYWMGASTYMINKSVADITPVVAIAISAGSIVLFWLIYDFLCKMTTDNRVILVVISLITIAATFAFHQVFGGRAAYISVGVMLGSTMGLNLWLVIAPTSIALQKGLKEGKGFDKDAGFIAKRRSQHNNYFTLPVVLTMVSNHFALAYNHHLAWLILVLLMFAGWGIRFALNTMYKKDKKLWGMYAAVVVSVLLAFAISTLKRESNIAVDSLPVLSDSQAMSIIRERCASCHSATPTQPGFATAPQGLALDKVEEVEAALDSVIQRTLVTRDMPIGNLTNMTEEEREQIRIWLDSLGGK